jgi:hypothetical protein
MAKGIDLGGMHAGDINDTLVNLIAQRMLEQDRATAAEDRRRNIDRQAMLDAQAAEDRTFTRSRLTKGDERTERLDAEAREDKDAKQALEMATLFPGKVVSGETMARVPKYLHELIAKPKDAQLASRSIGGVAVAGDPNAGEIDIEEHEAIAPGSFELQLPESERMRLAADRQTAAAAKREADERFRDEKLDRDTQHRERMAEIAANRAASAGRSGGGAMRKITYTDEHGDTVEEYVTPEEARARGPMKKPVTQKLVTGAERQTLSFYNRAKEASDMLTQGNLEGSIAQQNTMGQLWGQFAPNIAQSKEQQLYRQAQRAFTEARLRKESGAAIPPAEYDSDAKIYFAQPGDSKETIAQKQRARQAVLEGLKFSSGRAYGEFYGESGDGAPTKAGGDPGAGQQFDFDPKTGQLVPRGGR